MFLLWKGARGKDSKTSCESRRWCWQAPLPQLKRGGHRSWKLAGAWPHSAACSSPPQDPVKNRVIVMSLSYQLQEETQLGFKRMRTTLHLVTRMLTAVTMCLVWLFLPHHYAILGHQLSVLQFNSILTLSTPILTSDTNCKSRLSPVLLTNWL